METYLIYGKVVKPIKIFDPSIHKHIEMQPQPNFKALSYGGARVKNLSEAGEYAEKSDAEEKLEKVKENLRKRGIEDCIEFQIRKAPQ